MDLRILATICAACFIMTEANMEQRLYDTVMANYAQGGRYIRPVANYSTTLNVQFGVQLIDVDLDVAKRHMTGNGWFKYSWRDEFLSWDSTAFDNIDKLHVGVQNIWTPDVKIYASVDDLHVDKDAFAVVMSDGTVLWIPLVRFHVSCAQTSSGWFSKQEYKCPLTVGSWVYDGYKLDIDFYGEPQVDVSMYSTNNLWSVVNAAGKKDVTYYPCCKEPYPKLNYNITLRAK